MDRRFVIGFCAVILLAAALFVVGMLQSDQAAVAVSAQWGTTTSGTRADIGVAATVHERCCAGVGW